MKTSVILLAYTLILWCAMGCNVVANYPIDEPMAEHINERILGKWKFDEDTDKRNYYLIEPGKTSYEPGRYHVKFYNRGGTNRTYESNLYFSTINNQLFVNMGYFEPDVDSFKNEGYVFLKIIEANADYTQVTTATVSDTTLRALKSSAAVRKRLMDNLNNPNYYYDTTHFYKVR